MKKCILSFSMLISSIFTFANIYNIKELGADATGKIKCTVLINNTIQKAASEGGGTIYFPAGTYLTAAIHLKSNITIEVESGATIRFTDDFADYLPFVRMRWEGVFMNSLSPLLYAQGAENIAIKGRGTLDGNGFQWWKESLRIIAEINQKEGKSLSTNDLQQKWLDANSNLKVEPYYEKTLLRRFYRPPFIQFLECKNILIEGVKIINSPFWTINPEGCENIVIHGVTINNPSQNPKGHNTDGINPSSCKNVRISDCFITVGDDCITIKSGRDGDGRAYGQPCENLTITNCVMLAGHGGVVIGSEMSGSVRRVAISNCVFDGTDAGIRLKASRGRGGVVEQVRVDNIVMHNIQKNAFIFDLFYDKDSKEEPISERTPCFRNIHLANITGKDIKKVGYITGIAEMPIENISFSNINMTAETGFTAQTATNLRFTNCDFSVSKGASFAFDLCKNVVLDDVRAAVPLEKQAVVEIKNSDNMLITNCFQYTQKKDFYTKTNSRVVWGNNSFEILK